MFSFSSVIRRTPASRRESSYIVRCLPCPCLASRLPDADYEMQENDDAIRDILQSANVEASDIDLEVHNETEAMNDPSGVWP